MKILHVETGRRLYGGPQQVLYLVTALAERGHDCTLVCPPGSGIDGAARASGITVRNLFCAGDLDLPFAYRLTQFINEWRPAMVHCHSRRGADILGGLAASFADVPAVVSRRVDNAEPALLAALRFRPFRRIIAISEAVAAVLREAGIDGGRIEVIRSAVDAEQFAEPPDRAAFRREFGLAEGELVLAAAGQLIARKGHEHLIGAVAALAESGRAFRVLVFGDGELERPLREDVTARGLDDIIRFEGFREDLDRWMGAIDLLVHPALSEGLGVVTLKAQAAGVPVVGFRAGGVPEAVADGETGILVPPGDTAALAEALIILMDDAERRARYGAAGRARMRREFSVATMTEKHVELYERLLSD
ncbi:MAG TPA: glycosyltransferase [Woeseiaceae bacterium]|nr:glycosyltransferase [Woeseiaceae bacterium]